MAVQPVVYGMPGPELAVAAERGEVFLGGCNPIGGEVARCACGKTVTFGDDVLH